MHHRHKKIHQDPNLKDEKYRLLNSFIIDEASVKEADTDEVN